MTAILNCMELPQNNVAAMQYNNQVIRIFFIHKEMVCMPDTSLHKSGRELQHKILVKMFQI